MGVPAFARWLNQRYPNVFEDIAVPRFKYDEDNDKVIYDKQQPPPNGIMNNLYIDMNCLIHPCFHPENRPAPNTQDEIIEQILIYLDRLVHVVRPVDRIFFAIDGVAPRAKMNQQRTRRYVAAAEKIEGKTSDEKMRFFNKNGQMFLNNALQGKDCQDSNIITPGTPFMSYLAECIKDFAAQRASYDPFYQHVDIIFSDASVPGEGEHKIVDWIRRSRTHPDWKPNQTHVLYGLDADLIFLGLATHEPSFYILRENVLDRRPICNVCGDYGHKGCNTFPENRVPIAFGMAFQLCNLKKLRAYINAQLQPLAKSLGPKYDFERALDDWIALAFLCGNDFLPHLPSVAVKSGAVDKLTNLYVKIRPHIETWLTDGENFNLNLAYKIFEDLGNSEIRDLRLANPPQRQQQNRPPINAPTNPSQARLEEMAKGDAVSAASLLIKNYLVAENEEAQRELEDLQAAEREKKEASAPIKLTDDFSTNELEVSAIFSDVGSKIEITKEGYKQRYYEVLFGAGTKGDDIAKEYLKGLRWVYMYYFQGYENIDWSWYYPYHFAPLVSDFAKNTKEAMKLEFVDNSTPFKPFEQLLTVLPPVSGITVLPQCYARIMLDKENSAWYPRVFTREMNGCNVKWKSVALLSFVDQEKLLSQAAEAEKQLADDELKRNSLSHISILYNKNRESVKTNGKVTPIETKPFIPSFLNYFQTSESLIKEAIYEYPPINPEFGIRSRLLENCDAVYSLTEDDIQNFERENARANQGPRQFNRGPRVNTEGYNGAKQHYGHDNRRGPGPGPSNYRNSPYGQQQNNGPNSQNYRNTNGPNPQNRGPSGYRPRMNPQDNQNGRPQNIRRDNI